MKKQTPIYVLAAAIVLSAVLLCVCITRSDGTVQTAAVPYATEKLNEVSDMVLARQVVPQDYLRYLDEALAGQVTDYNSATASLRQGYTAYAEQIADSLLYPHDTSPGDYEQSELYFRWVDALAHNALYENAQELFLTDELLSYALMKETGSSSGVWGALIHNEAVVGEELAGQAADYFRQVDVLLTALDAARAAQ